MVHHCPRLVALCPFPEYQPDFAPLISSCIILIILFSIFHIRHGQRRRLAVRWTSLLAASYPGLLSDQPHNPFEILEWCEIWGVLCVAVKPDGTMQHTLVMGEGPETLFSMISTHTTLTHAAKW